MGTQICSTTKSKNGKGYHSFSLHENTVNGVKPDLFLRVAASHVGLAQPQRLWHLYFYIQVKSVSIVHLKNIIVRISLQLHHQPLSGSVGSFWIRLELLSLQYTIMQQNRYHSTVECPFVYFLYVSQTYQPCK